MTHDAVEQLSRSQVSRTLGSFEDDPVLARVEAALSASGGEIADIVRAGAATGAATGGRMMEYLAGLMAQRSDRSPQEAPSEGRTDPAPLINAAANGVEGLGRGLSGLAANRGVEVTNPETGKPAPTTTGTAGGSKAAPAIAKPGSDALMNPYAKSTPKKSPAVKTAAPQPSTPKPAAATMVDPKTVSSRPQVASCGTSSQPTPASVTPAASCGVNVSAAPAA